MRDPATSYRLWEPWEDTLLRRLYPDLPTAQLAAVLGRSRSSIEKRARLVLSLSKSPAYMAQTARAFQFKPGHTPPNKGVRQPPGWSRLVGCDRTQFRKGERHGKSVTNYQPIGTERLSKDGYRERKVNDDLPWRQRWRPVHLLLWEEAHGPVPAGHAVAFANGDRRDVRLENLTLVHRRELMARNTVLRFPRPLMHAILALGVLTRSIRRREQRV